MLKQMRTRTRKVMLATLILVIPSFVFFYGWNNMASRQYEAGEGNRFARIAEAGPGKFGVEGWRDWTPLTQGEVAAGRRSLRNDVTSRLGPETMQQMERAVGEENLFPLWASTNRAINRHILERRAEEQGVTAGEDEVRQQAALALEGIPRARWNEVLAMMGQTPNSFLASIRRDLRISKVEKPIRLEGLVSKQEVREQYLAANQELGLDYVAFEKSVYRDMVDPTTDTLRRWFEGREEDYRVPVQRQYKYAYLTRTSLSSQADLSTESVQQFYEENQERFREPRMVTLRHIYFEIPEAEDPDQRAERTSETLAEARGVRERLDAGEDFAALANEFSDDPQNVSPEGMPRGGLLPEPIDERSGSFVVGAQLSNAVMNMADGQTTGPLRVTSREYDGFSIARVEEVFESHVPPLEEIRDRVRNALRVREGERLFSEKLDELRAVSREYSDVDRLAAALGMQTGTTSWTLATDNVLAPQIVLYQEGDLDYLNDLLVGEMSMAMQSGQSTVFVAQPIKEKPSEIPPFADVMEEVREDYAEEKSAEMMREAAEAFEARATDFEAMRSIAAEEGMQVTTTTLFPRSEPPSDVPGGRILDFTSDSRYVTTGTIRLSPTGSNLAEPEAYLVWHVRELREPDPETAAEETAQYQAGLAMARQQTMLEEWLYDQRNYEYVVDYGQSFAPQSGL